MPSSLLCETVTGRSMADLRAARDAAVADMVEVRLDGIADLDVDEVDETDAEFDYVDVVEHLKVAVLMVHDTVISPDEESLDEWD